MGSRRSQEPISMRREGDVRQMRVESLVELEVLTIAWPVFQRHDCQEDLPCDRGSVRAAAASHMQLGVGQFRVKLRDVKGLSC